MSAWRWSVLVGGCLVACSSSSGSAPAPMPAPLGDPEHTAPDEPAPQPITPPPPLPAGGQSGTDASDGYNCQAVGAPPLQAVPLDVAPERIPCSPEAVLASIAGTRTFQECTVSSTGRAPIAGPVVTLRIDAGSSAHLLDAVLIEEDGTRGSCDALGVDISLASLTPGLELSADQVVVDHLCIAPAIVAKGRLSLASVRPDAGTESSDEVDLLLYFDGLTGHVSLLRFLAPEYTMDCVPLHLPPPAQDAG